MTDMVALALLAALPATLTAAAGLVVSMKNGGKADLAAVKQEQIHVLVNSNLAKVKNDLDEAKAEIRSLRDLVRELSGHTPVVTKGQP